MRTKNLTYAVGLTLAVIGAAGCSGDAMSRDRPATPATLKAVLLAAQGGDRLVLAAGEYGDVNLPRKQYSPTLTIAAEKARFTSIIIRAAGGITLQGGSVIAAPERTGIIVDGSQDISVSGWQIRGALLGIGVVRSQRVSVSANSFEALRSDGINVAASQQIRIEGNRCNNFQPTLPVFDAAGKMLRDGNHADCIQGWASSNQQPTRDITIIGNTARGLMQGVFFGNTGQGGISGVIVRDNIFELATFNGIVLMDARNSQVVNNTVRTVPNARMLNFPFRPVTAWIHMDSDKSNFACGNRVDQPRWSDGIKPCPRQRR